MKKIFYTYSENFLKNSKDIWVLDIYNYLFCQDLIHDIYAPRLIKLGLLPTQNHQPSTKVDFSFQCFYYCIMTIIIARVDLLNIIII